MARLIVVLCVSIAVAAAVPHSPILRKLDDVERYQYIQGPDGVPHLVDLWATVGDLREMARYDPDRQNVYHLFTRQNPQTSQPLIVINGALLGSTNFNPQRRTVVLIHGWLGNAASNFNAVLVPAFLEAEDVNIIVVDWSSGGGTINYVTAAANTVISGGGVARFISNLNAATGANVGSYHILGHSLGGHQSGIVGRNLGGAVPYITALDPAFPGWLTNEDRFRSTDGVYTEVIHTNAGVLGYPYDLGDADFYPNGGVAMPGCNSQECDHDRCFYYMAESVRNSGFLGRRCLSYLTAMMGNCNLFGSLRMGGLVPKFGQSGIFYLETNASPPFSRD